ncbi:MAG: hypothetical protein M1836_007117 [Candelina mexicana]|nr:MAG: hypothetical protein M1836_007117 [Candelina mexicana]
MVKKVKNNHQRKQKPQASGQRERHRSQIPPPRPRKLPFVKLTVKPPLQKPLRSLPFIRLIVNPPVQESVSAQEYSNSSPEVTTPFVAGKTPTSALKTLPNPPLLIDLTGYDSGAPSPAPAGSHTDGTESMSSVSPITAITSDLTEDEAPLPVVDNKSPVKTTGMGAGKTVLDPYNGLPLDYREYVERRLDSWHGPNEVQRSAIEDGYKDRLLNAKRAHLIDTRRQKLEEKRYSKRDQDRWWITIVKDKYNLTDEECLTTTQRAAKERLEARAREAENHLNERAL